MKAMLLGLLALPLFSLLYAQQPQVFHQDKPLPCLDKTFYVHVHTVVDENGNSYVTEEGLDMMFATVNTAFAPICARFEVCAIDTIDNYNYVRFEKDGPVFPEIRSRHHVDRRINFYFVNEILVDIGGFAPVGGIANVNNAWVAMAGLSAGTAIHELGHLFGLLHPFAGSGELVDGSNCETAGDGICDTPADPYVEGIPDSIYVDENCEFIYLETDANGDFYQPLVSNPMSYYPCGCGSFTYDQFLHMANRYLNANPKVW